MRSIQDLPTPISREELAVALAELNAVPVPYEFALTPARLPRAALAAMSAAWQAFRDGVDAFIGSYDDNLSRMAAALRLPEDMIPVWESLPAQDWALIARPDVLVSGGRPMIVDVNAHSMAGHFALNDLTLRAHQSAGLRPLFADSGRSRFVMGHYSDILRRYLGNESELIALSYFADEDEGDGNAFLWHYQAHACELERLGLKAEVVRVEDLEITPRAVYAAGRRVGLIQRFFIPEPDNDRHMSEIARISSAVRAELISVVTALRGELLNTKATIAVLSTEWFTDGLKPSLTARLRLAIPWTRLMHECHTFWQDERIDLPAWVLRNRERLVLKPTLGSLGRAVTIGREVSASDWTQRVHEALAGDEPWVVQELIVPDQEETSFIDASGALQTLRGPVAYGAYVLDGEMVGAIGRYGRMGDRGLMINGLTGAVPAPVYWTGPDTGQRPRGPWQV